MAGRVNGIRGVLLNKVSKNSSEAASHLEVNKQLEVAQLWVGESRGKGKRMTEWGKEGGELRSSEPIRRGGPKEGKTGISTSTFNWIESRPLSIV